MVLDLVEFQHLPYLTVDKGVPLLLIILQGTPNLTIMFFFMKFATAPPMALRSGTAFAHFVKYSEATMIHMYPCNSG